MTVKELIAALSKLDPDAQVTRKYHLHDYWHTVHAEPVRHVSIEEVHAEDKNLRLIKDEEERSKYRAVEVTPPGVAFFVSPPLENSQLTSFEHLRPRGR
jgi:hypothetical protein